MTILTGFLGSGKTTLLNRLMQNPAMEPTAVIVNEYNAVGIDDLLLRESASNAILLSNGCICCSIQESLPTTLQTLIYDADGGRVPLFSRVLIETTGLANPSPLLQLLIRDRELVTRFRMGGLIATVDAVNGKRTLDEHPEAVHQAAIADRIVMTKTDIVPSAVAETLTARLATINPSSSIVVAVNGHAEPAALLDVNLFKDNGDLDLQRWLPAHDHKDGPNHEQGHGHFHNHDIETFSIVRERPIRWDNFALWMEAIMLRRGPDLLRVKGIINIAEQPDEPIVIHGVQDVFHPPVTLRQWPTEDHRTRLVFITRNIKREVLEKTLDYFGTLDG